MGYEGLICEDGVVLDGRTIRNKRSGNFDKILEYIHSYPVMAAFVTKPKD